MADWVVDTNVLIVATRCELGCAPKLMARRGEDVPVQDDDAQESVFRWLRAVRESNEDRVVLDQPHGLIRNEYANKLLDSDYGRRVIVDKLTRGLVCWVEIEPDADGHAMILSEHGSAVSDPADRKMVAAALQSGAPIANACDTDWLDLEANGTLLRLGVRVHNIIETWCRADWHRKHGTTP